MRTSERASASIRQMPEKDRPISEEFRLVALKWVDADAAAALLEEMKTATLEQMKSRLIEERGEMPDNHATRLVKSSPEWADYIRQMCDSRSQANKFKVQLEYIRMRHTEWMAADATARAEMRLSR